MNYSQIKYYDIDDGPGIRCALYVSGCQLAMEGHPCKNCYNSVAWNKDFGYEFTNEVKQSLLDFCDHDYISGLSVLGGEPLSNFNLKYVTDLCKDFRSRFNKTKTIWIWTGYTVEQKQTDQDFKELLQYIDVIVDGPFLLEQYDPSLKFRGSSNQRILKNTLQDISMDF